MSIKSVTVQECPQCGTAASFDLFTSVNADRRPDLREAILDNTFMEKQCEGCGAYFRADPMLTYFDEELGLWINALPHILLEEWPQNEEQTRLVHFTTFGPVAPEIVAELGARLTPRMTFGWGALREKIVCKKHGFDDATVELAKLATIRATEGIDFPTDGSMRLGLVKEDRLVMVILNGPQEDLQGEVSVPLDLLEAIEEDAASWAPLREQIVGDYFVDLYRMLMPQKA